MKIIKKGSLPKDDVFRGTCRSCNSVIEWTRSELSVESCPREHYEFAHAKCPVCHSGMVAYPRKPL